MTRPGGRTARTEQVVLDAVRELVAAGTPRPPVALVAATARVNPATIYRRWGSTDALLLDVAVADVNASAPVAVSGDLRTDLLTYGRQLKDAVSQPGGLAFLHAIIAAASTPANGAEIALELLEARLEQFRQMLDATDRPNALEVIDLIDGLLAPVYLRALLTHPSTMTDNDVQRLIDNLLAVDASRRSAIRP